MQSFMRTLKKAQGALVDEGGRDWDRHLRAVALAHNSTPNTASGFPPCSLITVEERFFPRKRT